MVLFSISINLEFVFIELMKNKLNEMLSGLKYVAI